MSRDFASVADTFVGTNAYMSPERIRNESYGVRSEVSVCPPCGGFLLPLSTRCLRRCPCC